MKHFFFQFIYLFTHKRLHMKVEIILEIPGCFQYNHTKKSSFNKDLFQLKEKLPINLLTNYLLLQLNHLNQSLNDLILLFDKF